MAWELAAGSKESSLSALFRGASLLRRSGEAVSVLSGLKDRTVLLYFASTEAEPCRQFTPLLYKFYELARETDDSIAVVFVSDDKTKEEQLALFSSEEMHPDWLMVELLGVEDIMDAFDVKKIPSLVVLDREGKAVVEKARDEVWDLLQADREHGDEALKAAVAEKWAAWRRAAGDWRAFEGHTLGGGGGGGSSSSSAPFAAGSGSSSSAAPFGAGGAGAAGCPGAVPAAGTRSDREALRAARLAALERRGLAGASGGGSASSSSGFGEAGASSSSSSTAAAAGLGPPALAPAAAASASSSSSSSALGPSPPAASGSTAGGAGPPRIATLGGGGASSSSSGAAGASSTGGSGTFASGAAGAPVGGAAYTLAGGRIELPVAPPLTALLPPGIAEEDEDVVSDMASDGERSFRDESDLPEPDLGEAAAQIAAMGFPLDSAHRALQASNGDVDQAVAMLLGE